MDKTTIQNMLKSVEGLELDYYKHAEIFDEEVQEPVIKALTSPDIAEREETLNAIKALSLQERVNLFIALEIAERICPWHNTELVEVVAELRGYIDDKK